MTSAQASPDPGTTPAFRGAWSFLSNMHAAPFKAGGVIWPTVEHFYYAMKTLDPQEREWVRAAPDPKTAKFRGRKVSRREDWYDIKIDVMLFALRKKFQIPALREKLLATYPAPLIERNTWRDHFWGANENGEGQNHLGRCLMQVRDETQKPREENENAKALPRQGAVKTIKAGISPTARL